MIVFYRNIKILNTNSFEKLFDTNAMEFVSEKKQREEFDFDI